MSSYNSSPASDSEISKRSFGMKVLKHRSESDRMGMPAKMKLWIILIHDVKNNKIWKLRTIFDDLDSLP